MLSYDESFYIFGKRWNLGEMLKLRRKLHIVILLLIYYCSFDDTCGHAFEAKLDILVIAVFSVLLVLLVIILITNNSFNFLIFGFGIRVVCLCVSVS